MTPLLSGLFLLLSPSLLLLPVGGKGGKPSPPGSRKDLSDFVHAKAKLLDVLLDTSSHLENAQQALEEQVELFRSGKGKPGPLTIRAEQVLERLLDTAVSLDRVHAQYQVLLKEMKAVPLPRGMRTRVEDTPWQLLKGLGDPKKGKLRPAVETLSQLLLASAREEPLDPKLAQTASECVDAFLQQFGGVLDAIGLDVPSAKWLRRELEAILSGQRRMSEWLSAWGSIELRFPPSMSK
jgi:hypothetical protein